MFIFPIIWAEGEYYTKGLESQVCIWFWVQIVNMGKLFNLWWAPVCFSVKYERNISSIRDGMRISVKPGSGKGTHDFVFTNGTHDFPGHSDTLRPNSIWFLQVVYSWALDWLLGLLDV